MLVVCFHQIAPYWLQTLLVVEPVACTPFSWTFHCFEIVVLYQEPLTEHSAIFSVQECVILSVLTSNTEVIT